MIRAYYADDREVNLPPGHRFPMNKYRLLRERLGALGLIQARRAPDIAQRHLARAHTREYIESVRACALDRRAERRLGLPLDRALVRRAHASAGGTLAATEHALRAGFCGNLSGGTHHAFAGHGEGFCVFNDLAVAGLWLLAQGGLERVAVVDLDVHQGNGTASICQGHAGIYTLSIHCEKNYPFEKVAGTHDVSMPEGAEDAEYLAACQDALERVWQWEPQCVLYQAGVDGLWCDRLGRLALTHEGLRQRDRYLMIGCQRRNIPVVMTLGGGYGEPIEQTIEAYVNSYREAAAIFG